MKTSSKSTAILLNRSLLFTPEDPLQINSHSNKYGDSVRYQLSFNSINAFCVILKFIEVSSHSLELDFYGYTFVCNLLHSFISLLVDVGLKHRNFALQLIELLLNLIILRSHRFVFVRYSLLDFQRVDNDFEVGRKFTLQNAEAEVNW
jgi:hypothetical protein